jgi:hypothetical protein
MEHILLCMSWRSKGLAHLNRITGMCRDPLVQISLCASHLADACQQVLPEPWVPHQPVIHVVNLAGLSGVHGDGLIQPSTCRGSRRHAAWCVMMVLET